MSISSSGVTMLLDNSRNAFFFLPGLYSSKGQYLRVDLRFLHEGHTYSVCDRRFGSIQTLFERNEVIDIP